MSFSRKLVISYEWDLAAERKLVKSLVSTCEVEKQGKCCDFFTLLMVGYSAHHIINKPIVDSIVAVLLLLCLPLHCEESFCRITNFEVVARRYLSNATRGLHPLRPEFADFLGWQAFRSQFRLRNTLENFVSKLFSSRVLVGKVEGSTFFHQPTYVNSSTYRTLTALISVF